MGMCQARVTGRVSLRKLRRWHGTGGMGTSSWPCDRQMPGMATQSRSHATACHARALKRKLRGAPDRQNARQEAGFETPGRVVAPNTTGTGFFDLAIYQAMSRSIVSRFPFSYTAAPAVTDGLGGEL